MGAMFRPRRGDTLSTYHPSLGERIGDAAGRLAMRLCADRHGYQNVARKVQDVIGWVPGLGEAVAGDDVLRAVRRRDYAGAGIGAAGLAAGFVPVVGDAAAKAIREARNPARMAAERAKNLASRQVRIYDPPAKPQRDFALDYPQGADADEAGKLRYDMERRPLGGRYVVGRQMVGEPDRSLGYEGLVDLGTSLTREGISRSKAGDLGGNAGRSTYN
jgi:hypothetical protein